MEETVNAQLSDFFNGKMTPEAFEEWLGQSSDLKELVTEDDYIRITSTDFKLDGARTSLENILRKYIDWAQYEKEKLAEVLMAIIWRDNAIEAMVNTYERYCNGQRFLRTLGNKYGKLFAQAEPNSLGKFRRLLAEPQPIDQDTQFNGIYPEASAEAKRLLGLLIAERIQFTGTYTEGGCPEYTEQ